MPGRALGFGVACSEVTRRQPAKKGDSARPLLPQAAGPADENFQNVRLHCARLEKNCKNHTCAAGGFHPMMPPMKKSISLTKWLVLTSAVLFAGVPAVPARDSFFGDGAFGKSGGSSRPDRTASSKHERDRRLWGSPDRWRSSAGRGGPKRVEIDLSSQRLHAWEGDRLVMSSRVSSGRGGSTPTGRYAAGPYKARSHHSSLYHNAYMPWSVQVSGDVFIHGFSEVPRHPASHGCIRLPVTGSNPARRFYEWVDVGTPIRIVQ